MRLLTVILFFFTLTLSAQEVYKGWLPYYPGRDGDTTIGVYIQNSGDGYSGFYGIRETDTFRLHWDNAGEVVLNHLDSLYLQTFNLYYLNYSASLDTIFINSDTLKLGGGGDTCLWYYVADDTIKTWHNVWVDSSLNMKYTTNLDTYYFLNGDNSYGLGYPNMGWGFNDPYNSDSSGAVMIQHNDGYRINITSNSLTHESSVTVSNDGVSMWGYLPTRNNKIELTTDGIDIESDSVITLTADSIFAQTIPEENKQYILMIDGNTGKVTKTDTANVGWGGGADTCLWEITSGDTIDTKGYNVKLDSNLIADYKNYSLGIYTDFHGFMEENGIAGGYYVNDDSLAYLYSVGNQIALMTEGYDGQTSVQLTSGYIILDGNKDGGGYIKMSTDSLVIDTLPQSAKRFIMTWDSATGQVFAMDTTGWGGGSGGYWTEVGNYLYPDNITDSVVIGGTTPNYPFDVTGNAQITGNLHLGELYLNSADAGTSVSALVINGSQNIDLNNLSDDFADIADSSKWYLDGDTAKIYHHVKIDSTFTIGRFNLIIIGTAPDDTLAVVHNGDTIRLIPPR